jgi:DNA-binding transcriptional MerR regulator
MDEHQDMTDDQQQLLSIGEFAERSRLSLKALRIYDSRGLLRPRAIDPGSGYRRYGIDQLPVGRLIALLRGADLSLAAIESVLSEQAKGGAESACAHLELLLAELNRDHDARRLVIRHVQSILREESDPMFQIHTREVPARRLMSIQRRLHGHQTDAFVHEAKAAFRAHLGSVEPTGPFTMIFHGPVNDQADGPLEVVLGVPDDIQPTELIGIHVEPAHAEAYTAITKRQWDFPAILAAYDAVAASPEVAARPGSQLSCREVYVAEPDAIGDDDLICDIAYPLGEATG